MFAESDEGMHPGLPDLGEMRTLPAEAQLAAVLGRLPELHLSLSTLTDRRTSITGVSGAPLPCIVSGRSDQVLWLERPGEAPHLLVGHEQPSLNFSALTRHTQRPRADQFTTALRACGVTLSGAWQVDFQGQTFPVGWYTPPRQTALHLPGESSRRLPAGVRQELRMLCADGWIRLLGHEHRVMQVGTRAEHQQERMIYPDLTHLTAPVRPPTRLPAAGEADGTLPVSFWDSTGHVYAQGRQGHLTLMPPKDAALHPDPARSAPAEPLA